MEENTAPVGEAEAPVEGGESTTPEEVSQILGLNTPEAVAEEGTEDEQEEVETPSDETEEPGETEEPLAEVEKAVETPAEPAAPEEAPSFALEIEDANGEKVTINPGDDLEQVLENFEPKSNGQIFQIIKQVTEMENKKSAWDAEQEAAALEAETAQRLTAIQDGWDNEIKKLQGEKRLEATADGKPNERVQQVFKYMAEENKKRDQAGTPLIQSFEDALDKFELSELKEKQKEDAKKEKELVRKRGSLVGGASAPATGGQPVYKAGTARNASEAIHALGLL